MSETARNRDAWLWRTPAMDVLLLLSSVLFVAEEVAVPFVLEESLDFAYLAFLDRAIRLAFLVLGLCIVVATHRIVLRLEHRVTVGKYMLMLLLLAIPVFGFVYYHTRLRPRLMGEGQGFPVIMRRSVKQTTGDD